MILSSLFYCVVYLSDLTSCRSFVIDNVRKFHEKSKEETTSRNFVRRALSCCLSLCCMSLALSILVRGYHFGRFRDSTLLVGGGQKVGGAARNGGREKERKTPLRYVVMLWMGEWVGWISITTHSLTIIVWSLQLSFLSLLSTIFPSPLTQLCQLAKIACRYCIVCA